MSHNLTLLGILPGAIPRHSVSRVINRYGRQRRALTHAADVVRALDPAVRWRGGGLAVLNVGTGRNHSVQTNVYRPTKLAQHRSPPT